MQMRRCLPVLVTIWVLCLACMAGAHAAEQKAITLHHYKFNARANQLEILQKLAEEFHTENPHISVDITTGPEGPEYEEKVKVMLAGGAPPDVTEFYPAIASTMAEGKQFLDLRPYMAKDSRYQEMDIAPVALASSTWSDGTVFALPALMGANILAFNGDLLFQAGAADPSDMGVLWNWDEMMSMVRKIARDTNADGGIDIWGNMGRNDINRTFTFMQQAGGLPYDTHYAPTTANFMRKSVIAGAQFAADLLDANLGTTKYNNFINGKAGFCWIGIFPFSVELARIRLGGSPIDFRVSPWPTGPAGNRYTVAEVRGWQIMKDSQHIGAAWEWLAFVHLNRQRALEYADVHGWIPASRKLQGVWLERLGFTGVERQMVHIALQSTLESGNVPNPAGPGVLETASAWKAGFANVISKKTPLETFLEQMNTKAAQLLAR
jgi:multiple sugar transport system substrate-binding protein